jgi:hypothetical protein
MHDLATDEQDSKGGWRRLLLAAFWKMHDLATDEQDSKGG